MKNFPVLYPKDIFPKVEAFVSQIQDLYTVPVDMIIPNDICEILENSNTYPDKRVAENDKRPYKLVVLNACETFDPNFSSAFGIDFLVNKSCAEYELFSRDPRAFVGWSNEIDVPGSRFGFPSYVAFYEYGTILANFWGRWMNNQPLENCLRAFDDGEQTYRFEGLSSWRISGCRDLQRFQIEP